MYNRTEERRLESTYSTTVREGKVLFSRNDKPGMFGLGMVRKKNFLVYSTQVVFLTIRLVPGNVVMVTLYMCRKSPITGEWIYGITWKHEYFNISVLFIVDKYFYFKISVSYYLLFLSWSWLGWLCCCHYCCFCCLFYCCRNLSLLSWLSSLLFFLLYVSYFTVSIVDNISFNDAYFNFGLISIYGHFVW